MEESSRVDRRTFMAMSAGVLALAGRGGLPAADAMKLRKALCIGVLPRDIPVADRFRMARDAGFEGVEPNTLLSTADVDEYARAARETGLRIHSIMNSDHWKYPLTDDDPEVVRKCVEGIRTSLRNARDLGADTILLVPGIVTPSVGYAEVYRRSQEQIRKLLSTAKEVGIVIAVENVGNRFLLSPIEFARYIDEFESPWVRGYFDVGNVVAYGFPPDWIRAIGPRLARVHLKRFEPGGDYPKFDPADRRTQGIDWRGVSRALAEVKYTGWVTAEVKSGDAAYLKELSSRMDRILAGEYQ